MEARAHHADRKRLGEIEAQLDRAARLAVKTGGVEAATRIIGELDVERAKIERRLASDSPNPDMNTLRQVIEERCQEMATGFEASPAEGRVAMLELLVDRRIQVGTDAERSFRVDGIFELSLMHEPPRSNHASEGACVVAGEGFAGELRSPEQRSEASSLTPRPPGYEKVFAFLKIIEATQSYRLAEFSGCAGWVSLAELTRQ